LAFLCYDFLLTLDREVELFWSRGLNGASVLFFVTRYWTLFLYVVVDSITFVQLSDTCFFNLTYIISSCAYATRVQAVLGILQYLPFAAFSALRVLALSRMNWPLAVVVLILSIGPAITNFARFGLGITGSNVATIGCQPTVNVTVLQGKILSVVSRTTLIIADLLVIIVTVFATRNRGTAPLRRLRRSSLGDVLFYNGPVLLVFNVLQVVLTHISIGPPKHELTRCFAVSLTAIFVCRFLCDLQTASKNSIELGESGTLQSSSEEVESLGFARVLGSLGASVDYHGAGDGHVADGELNCEEDRAEVVSMADVIDNSVTDHSVGKPSRRL
ncbi:hypothetical protein C8Q79DRAFT_920877, partial [Trametes meyenii]